MLARKMAVSVLLMGSLLFAAGCAYTPDVNRRPDMNEGQAALAVTQWLRENATAYHSVCVTGDPYVGLQLVAKGQAAGDYCPNQIAGYRFLEIEGPDVPRSTLGRPWPQVMPECKRLLDYVYAIRYWRSAKGKAEKAAAFARFQESARAWRALPVKPDLPPAVERFRILAENAFREKKLGDAADYYEQALAVMPLWPEGWYNAAAIYAEERCYAQAALDMKRYLELCPDARDSAAARQEMYIWEERAKKVPFPIPDGVSRASETITGPIEPDYHFDTKWSN